MMLVVVSIISFMLTKTLVISLKFFTVIIYGFQNFMLYRPFIFREHKKTLSKWFLRLSLSQTAAIFLGSIVWSMILVMYEFHDADSCSGVHDRARSWQIVSLSLTAVGYILSCFLSLVFIIGYRWKNSKDLGQSETKSIQKTMMACSIEILFDFVVPLVRFLVPTNCFAFDIEFYAFAKNQLTFDSKCGLPYRLGSLDSGLSLCSTAVLILQPIVQELFFLISELVDYCNGRQGPS